MGSLAKWGAIAGGAGAAKEHFEEKAASESREAKSSSDEARTARMLALKERYAESTQGREFGQETSQLEAKLKSQEQMGTDKLGSAEMIAWNKEKGAMERTQAEIEGRKDVAGITGASRIAASAGRGSAGKPQYSSVKLKLSEATAEGFTDKEVPLTFDKTDGKYYESKGGKLIEYKLRDHLNPVEQILFDNPGARAAYLNSPRGKKHGLPEWYAQLYGTE